MLKSLRPRPHRLAVQDAALSRLKRGFDSPWGHKQKPSFTGGFSHLG
jgi:hypothetical protein